MFKQSIPPAPMLFSPDHGLGRCTHVWRLSAQHTEPRHSPLRVHVVLPSLQLDSPPVAVRFLCCDVA